MITLTDRSLSIPLFNGVIHRLQLKGYSIDVSHVESDNIFIMFNNIYVFNSIPQGFEIMESIQKDYNNRTNSVTIIVNSEIKSAHIDSELNSNLTTKQINERLQELAEWVTKVNPAIFGRSKILTADNLFIG